MLGLLSITFSKLPFSSCLAHAVIVLVVLVVAVVHIYQP